MAATADAVAIAHTALLRSAGAEDGRATMAQARARGLEVWAWTLRAENAFLPEALRRGAHGHEHGAMDVQVREAVALGVSGLVGDQPALLRRAASVG